MADRINRNYQSIPDMAEYGATVPGKRFFVQLAGKTNGAHIPMVRRMEELGQTQVSSPDDSDYTLLFCPIVSRAGTDIDEALNTIPDDRQVIMVVMHHTFNPNHVLAESRRLVTKPNFLLVVDCLFFEGNLLESNCNNFALYEIQKCLGVPPTLPSYWNKFLNWMKEYQKTIAVCVGVAVVVCVVVVLSVELEKKMKRWS